MQNKSSWKRILWSLAYVAAACVGMRVATTGQSAQLPIPPGRERMINRKPWRVEPVTVVAVKNKRKPNIEIGRVFDDDDDWLDGFTVRVKNNSDQNVTAVIVEMIFRREAGDTRPPVAELLNFGPPPMLPAYLRRNPNKIIKVGETADLELNSYNYKMLTERLLRRGYVNGTARVELVINEVGFEDGSVLDSGTLWLRDPNNPNDPTKRIRADKLKPAVRNHHANSSQVSRIVNSEIRGSLRRNGSNLAQVHTDECYQPEAIRFVCCDQSEGCLCIAMVRTIDPFSTGSYDAELQFMPCLTYDEEHDTWVDCGFDQASPHS